MATIYLSSTYNDLKACREAVYHALRQMRHDVIAMEDYVATDQRPTEKCLADVTASDLYVGIFAWRYGFIPSEMNPQQKSITELEFRQATQAGKPCLIFLLDKDAPWPPTAMDVMTGEGNRGERIKSLRDELAQEKIVSFFKTAEELVNLVGTAVHLLEKSRTNSSTLFSREHSEKVKREARLKKMLADHSSFMHDRLSSFVGRDKELAEIQRRISEKQETGGYVTITGQAGQGKSCIIAKLIDENEPENVAFHFIPFNPGPDHQIGLLRNLMARLILKYELSDLYVASESRAALRDYFSNVLSELVAKGGREVIFIDGLDQLEEEFTGERDLSFLPNNPPPGVIFVLGTRPNDTLNPLELLKPYYEYQLPTLSRQDFDLLLQHRHVQLNKDVADQFYKAMGENALYLDLVAKELAKQETIDTEDLIAKLADNPSHIFSLAIARFKRRPFEWNEVIKPILGVLLVTREPLGLRCIRQIIGDERIDDQRLQDGIERLGGLVRRDRQYRYSLFHLKLYEYLRQDKQKLAKEYIFATEDEEFWHKKIAMWCEQEQLLAIWQNTPQDDDEQQRKIYARQYYILHLYHGKKWNQLFAVLDTMQYGHAKVQFDPSTHSYAQDVYLGRQAASWDGWTLEKGISLLQRLWQYTLLQSSLTSRADQYPITAFQLLVLLNRKHEALGLAELLTNPEYKACTLLRIAEQLRKQASQESEWLEVFLRIFDVIQTIKQSKVRAKVSRELGIALTQAQQWERAEAVIRTIKRGDVRAQALLELSIALAQAQQWERAETITLTIERGDVRAQALLELSIGLVQAQQWERAEAIWTKAKAIYYLIEDIDGQIQMSLKLGIAYTQAQQWERAEAIWTEAEAVIQSIEDSDVRTQTLLKLVTALAQAQRWERAEAVIQSIEDSDVRTQALRELGIELARAQQWEHAEAIIQSIEHNYIQTQGLLKLVKALLQAQQWERSEAVIHTIEQRYMLPHLKRELGIALAQAQQWERAETIISTIKDNYSRTRALRELGIALAQAQQWERAETITLTIERGDVRAQVLLELSIGLVQAQQWERAEAITLTIEHIDGRVQALRELGTALAQAQQWERAEAIWTKAKAVIRTIEYTDGRAQALRELGTALAQAQQWERAEAIIGTIQDSDTRIHALRELGIAMAQAQQWERAEAVIQLIEDNYSRARALLKLGTALTQARSWKRAEIIWTEAEKVIRLIGDIYSQTQLMQELGVTLVQAQQWERAVAIINTIKDRGDQAQGLRELGVALAQAQQWERAVAIINALMDSVVRAQEQRELDVALAQAQQGLRELGVALAQAQQWERAEAIIDVIKDRDAQAQGLRELGVALAQAQQWERAEAIWTKAKAVILTIRDGYTRAQAWLKLGIALTRVQGWERTERIWSEAVATLQMIEAEKVIRLIGDSYSGIHKIGKLGLIPAQEQQWELAGANEISLTYNRVSTDINTIMNSQVRTQVLQELGSALIQAQQWERAEVVIRIIKNSQVRIQVLQELGSALIQAQQWERAEAIIRTIKDSKKQIQVLRKLGRSLAQACEYDRLLHLIHYYWLLSGTRENAFELFPLAIELIQKYPELGATLYEAFTWVDNFLYG